MIKTEYGNFTSGNWEEEVSKCLNKKYKTSFKSIPANNKGDYGIDGISNAEVFQCYCPEIEYTPNDMHERLRGKIRGDLNKLVLYEAGIKNLMGDQKISKWILITPCINNKKTFEYATKKQTEYRLKNLDILSNDFEVILKDINFVAPELQSINKMSQEKINLLNVEISDEKFDEIKNNNEMVKNIYRKFSKVLHSEKLIKEFTEKYIDYYVKGILTLNQLNLEYPNLYNEYCELKNSNEDLVEEGSGLNNDNYDVFLHNTHKEILKDLQNTFSKSFNPKLIRELSNGLISSWLAECPLDFNIVVCNE